jgi:hypothetical protein
MHWRIDYVTKQEDLTTYIFTGRPHFLSKSLTLWMEDSSRFTAFVETYRDKIRKKIRVTSDMESFLDLRSELYVAYRLLNDRRLVVAYEPYASAKRRGPDFSVSYRVNLVFNVEVARMRAEQNSGNGLELPRYEERILRILLDKLGQMQPGLANLLVIHTQEQVEQSIDLDRLMQEIKTRVEKRDQTFYAGSRYINPAAFYKDYLHLSGILLWAESVQEWANKQARPNLSEKVFHLVSALLSGTGQVSHER